MEVEVEWRPTPSTMGQSWSAHASDDPPGRAADAVRYSTGWTVFCGRCRVPLGPFEDLEVAKTAGTAWIVENRRRHGSIANQRRAWARAEAEERHRRRWGLDDPAVVRDHGWDHDLTPDPDRHHDDI